MEVSEMQLTEIACLISHRLPMSALGKHESGRHEPVVVIEKSKVTQREKDIMKIILEAQDSQLMRSIQEFHVPVLLECCPKTIEMLAQDLQRICENSKDHYAHWMKERLCRITGSICYGLYTYTQNKRSDAEWKKKLDSVYTPKDFKTESMDHGSKTESEARNAFRKVINSEVIEVGLIVSKLNPWLAYSPDGILVRNSKPIALLEIKCPLVGKKAGITETVKSQIKGCLVQEGENIVMRKKHGYYGQVQLGMAVLNLNVTYFVIYSSFDKKLFVLKVARDDSFITTMLKALKKLYFNRRLHQICIKKGNCNETDSQQVDVETVQVK